MKRRHLIQDALSVDALSQNLLPGVSPSMVGVILRVLGVSPRMVGVIPRVLGVSPSMVVVIPRVLGVSPSIVGVMPRVLGVSPSMVGVIPRVRTAMSDNDAMRCSAFDGACYETGGPGRRA